VAPRTRTPRSRFALPGLAAAPRRLHAYAVAAALVAGALLIGLSQISVHRGAAAPSQGGGALAGIAETAALLDGIPQRGNTLGSPTAPVRLVEYADPQCPFCAQYARDVLPTLIRDYVRTGKVELVFRGLWFLGPDSGTALRTVTAAAPQKRFWNALELLYRNQGPENAWVTDGVLRSIVTGAGANADSVFAARDGRAVTTTIDGWSRLAQADGINAVPAFFVGRRGGAFERLQVAALSPSEFSTALDRVLRP
jgi:protein-disulfide isomerase